jgi:hypothetical protein
MFNMDLPKHGEDKNVIDGLNNKIIKILQEDGLICHERGKSIGQTKGVKMYNSETPRVDTSSR